MKTIAHTLLALLLVLRLHAQDAAPTVPASAPPPVAAKPGGDPDLPQTFDPTTLAHVVTASPFNRNINLADSLVLTGIAGVGKQLMATLYDKEKKKTWVVTDEPNSMGMRLVEVNAGSKIDRSQVKVAIGTETVTIRHNDAAAIESRKGSPGGPPPRGDRVSENDKGYKRSMKGPPPEVREKYEALSPAAKEKVHNLFRDNREKLQGMNDEQRRSFMESNFNKIVSEDGGGGSADSKPEKHSKKEKSK
jgi:hypothetical protein